MRVLRRQKQSLLAVLEAFIHDPLLSWKVLTMEQDASSADGISGSENTPVREQGLVQLDASPKSNDKCRGQALVESMDVNKKAYAVIRRIQVKLSGKDFGTVIHCH